jgi:hypothetical protein
MKELWTKEQIERSTSIIIDHGCECSCNTCNLFVHKKCLMDKPNKAFYEDSGLHFVHIRNLHLHDADTYTLPCIELNEEETKQLLDHSAIHPSTDERNKELITRDNHDYWRYRFAGQAMESMGNIQLSRNNTNKDIDFIAETAIAIADKLLEKLEKTK